MSYAVPFEVPTLTYRESLDRLHATLKLGIQPLLETVVDMLAELENPDKAFRAVQIAGTNGKTSTSRFASAILRGEGLRCALYTSPELVSYTERMEVDGASVSEEQFAYGISAAIVAGERVNAARAAAGERPYDITEFDLLTVAACVVYAEAGVEVAVLECGMGGRWDATSAISSIEAVAITGVGLDHTRILGTTVEAIATEKAAIIQRGRSCVLGVGTALPPSVEDVFLERCKEQSVCPVLLRPEKPSDAAGVLPKGEMRKHPELPSASYRITKRPRRLGFPLEIDVATSRAVYPGLAALKPPYQAPNMACAVSLCEGFLGRALDEERLYDALVTCPTPGRFSLVRPEPPILIDACHNPQSVETFLASLRELEPDVQKRPRLLCAVLADKDVEGIVGLLAPEFPRVTCTQTASPRALAATELAKLFAAQGATVEGAYSTVGDALDAVCEDSLVVVGSITLAGEVAAKLA